MSTDQMNRSRTQLANVYSPGSFFTFEGGLGACKAVPVRADRAENLGHLVEEQILELISDRAKSWLEQGRMTPRATGQPPIEEPLLLDPRFHTGDSIELLRDRCEFLVPERMGYQPMPMTFVCRRCQLLKGFDSVDQFIKHKAKLQEGCPEASCANDWEQLDVAFVHWSGGYAPITLSENHWDRAEQRVYPRPLTCTCNNKHFRLRRPAPVFSKWRLECTHCNLTRELPVQQDLDTLNQFKDTIQTGSHWRIETNMEPVSVRASAAYYVQTDRLLAFKQDTWFSMLKTGRHVELTGFLAAEYGYPTTSISDQQKEAILIKAQMGSVWASYKTLKKFYEMHLASGDAASAQGMLDGLQALEAKWRDKLPPEYQPSQTLSSAARNRSGWPRKYDPIRQAVEHKTLVEILLGPSAVHDVVNVREPDLTLLPGLPASEADKAKALIRRELDMLGIEDMRMIRKFPVCEFSFGYTRTSSDPWVERKKENITINLPVRLNLFERVHLGEGTGVRNPIYVLRQDNEAFYVRLREEVVKLWLEANGFTINLPAPNARLGSMLIETFAAAPFSKWLDEYRGKSAPESRNPYAYVYTLLHTMAHHLMHELAHVSGLDLGNMSEHLFVPDLAFVVYRRGTTMDLNYLSSAWRAGTDPAVGNIVLRRMLDPSSLRCGSGSLCDNRGGACPDCMLIPEISCITRNNLLSRSVLRGVGHPHWDETVHGSIPGYYGVATGVANGTVAPAIP